MSVSVGGTYCKYKRTGKNAGCPAAFFKQNESAFVRLQETHMRIMHLHKFICVFVF